jgi:ribonuclease J
MKKEIKDEITHILYDQTSRTPIVIPVINEIGGANQAPQQGNKPNATKAQAKPFVRPAVKNFPPKQVPDTEAVQPKPHFDTRGY